MIVRMTAGTLGLLAFAASIFAGVWVGNDPMVVLYRAWVAMMLFIIVGAIFGWMAQMIVKDHIKNALNIDLDLAAAEAKNSGTQKPAKKKTTGQTASNDATEIDPRGVTDA